MPLVLARFTVKRYDPRQSRDRLGRWTSTPGGGSVGRERPTLAELMPQRPPENRREWQETKRRAGEGVAKAIDGEYAGITVAVNQDRVQVEVDKLAFAAPITFDGRTVGEAAFEFERRDGQLVAEFLLLTLEPNVQGRGFAGRFVGEMEQWCRESGVAYIALDAGLSGGGYAWASRGYDWWDERQPATSVLPRLANEVDKLTAMLDRADLDSDEADRLADQLTSGRAVLDRLRGEQFGAAGYPTPYEVSQAGRRPEQTSTTNPDEWWIGKTVTMGSSWRGVKRL